jgi:hypothetical protein
MATIINNPPGESESSGVVFAIGIMVLLILGAVLVMNYLPGAVVAEDTNEPGVRIEVVPPNVPAPPADTAE